MMSLVQKSVGAGFVFKARFPVVSPLSCAYCTKALPAAPDQTGLSPATASVMKPLLAAVLAKVGN